MGFLDTLLGRKHPPMIGLDISSSSVTQDKCGGSAAWAFSLAYKVWLRFHRL